MTLDIVMPFYGRLDHLQIAVASVLAQDDPDVRLVVVDDAYPDEEPIRWLRSLSDDRITALRNVRNLGVSASFARAVELASAPHVTIMGCDDVMLPGYVRHMRALLRQFPDVDFVQPGVTIVGGDGEPSTPLADRVKRRLQPRGPRPLRLEGQRLAASLSTGNWCYFPSIAWRVETVARIGFREDLATVQDLAMLLAIVADGGSIVLDDETVFAYRRHASSVSMTLAADGRRFAEERAVLDEAAETFARLGWRTAARAARLRATSRLNAGIGVPGALARGDRRGATTLLRHALATAARS